MQGGVKIKSVGVGAKESRKNLLSKKKVLMFAFDDTVLFTQLPKKSKSNPSAEIYPFLDASPVTKAEADKNNVCRFSFDMDGDIVTITAPTEEEAKKWIKGLQLHTFANEALSLDIM